MVGRLPDARRAGRLGFAEEGDAIALVGPFAPSLAASELAKLRGEPLPDGLPEFDLDGGHRRPRRRPRGRALGRRLERPRHRRGRARGGAGRVLPGRRAGARVSARRAGGSPEAALFGEGPAASCSAGPRTGCGRSASDVPLRLIGTVGGDAPDDRAGGRDGLEVGLAELARRTRRAVSRGTSPDGRRRVRGSTLLLACEDDA